MPGRKRGAELKPGSTPGSTPGSAANPDAEMRSSGLLRRETVRLDGVVLAQVLILPVGKLDPATLLGSLNPRDRDRAASLLSPARYAEYVTSRWLLQQLPTSGPVTIAVAGSDNCALGLDVESRLPRHLAEVAERLGWGEREPPGYLQAWTLWEAWRKLAGGSVLDAPDLVYAEVLAAAPGLFAAPQRLSTGVWWSLALAGGCLSLAVRTPAEAPDASDSAQDQ
jgi:hypothetical protein